MKDNKLIAEFMGFRVEPYESPTGRMGARGYGFQNPNASTKIEGLNYFTDESESWDSMLRFANFHKSWDWLMPVVEKIDELGYNITIGYVTKGEPICGIMFDQYNEVYIENKNSLHETVYEAVIEFIKWYNEDKK